MKAGDGKLTDSTKKAHRITLKLAPGVRLAEVEMALGRSGLTVTTSGEDEVYFIREIPPMIAPRSRYPR